MQLFINEKNNVVTEAIDGLICGSGDKLSRLDGYPHIKVVVRRLGQKQGGSDIGRRVWS